MRLTLRTLLAYLDGILEPDDAQDLGKKVEESEFAVGLVHRLRDVMRRLRLGAPSLTDRGPGLDPNTVAEYLDNTLASERVTDFEKVCLDSDTHLAEVGSCHQILTLVLGEPAEVDPASRQRMYQLQEVHSGAKPPPTPVTPAAGTSAPAGPPLSLDLDLGGDQADRRSRPRPTVPEYLREPRGRRAWLSAAAVVLAAACVIAVVAWMCGQLEPGTTCGNVLVRWGVIAAAPRAVAKGDTKEGDAKGAEQPGPGGDVKEGLPSGNSAVDDTKGPKGSDVPPAGKSPAERATSVKPIVEPAGGSEKGTRPADTAKAPPKTNGGATSGHKAIPPPVIESKSPPAPAGESAVVPKAKPDTHVERPPTPDAQLPPELLGGLLSGEQVLLSNNAENGWTRVGANQMLIPQHVLALPTYRARIVLTLGITLEILGGTRVELLGSTPQEMPGIRVLYGRVVMKPRGKAKAQMRVAFGDHDGMIVFDDTDSVAAVEVCNLHTPGTNPKDAPRRVTAELFAASGGVAWEEAAKEKDKAEKPIRLTPLQRLSFDAALPGQPYSAKNLPDWIIGDETLKAPDRMASPVIAQMLPSDRSARVGLLELATSHPRKEVRSLAVQCLGYVGQFSDMVKALNSPRCKNEWRDFYVPQLRAAVARDAETATAVQLALEKEFPRQAADLYRMLWGYTNDQLEAGEDATLVQGLKNDESLPVRVLSYWNLRDITGKGAIYNPAERPISRQAAVQHWKQRLEAKDIRFAADRAPAAPRNPVVPRDPAK
jgi:hypothetical protein